MNILVIEQQSAELDLQIIESVCHPENPYKMGKKGGKSYGENVECDYYMFTTNVQYHENPGSLPTERFNNLIQQARARNFNNIMLII